ncbi:MAG: ParB N-terminal domain-containing protein [Rhizobiaceae bacterium]|nr:ParB N-terminal domain-containing protein [Rhizobiaceae bacterium]
MNTYKQIKISEIHVPERLRAVEEGHAVAIMSSIYEVGLIEPITVRSTPNAKNGAKPYTLITGAHRLRAVEMMGEPKIETLVVTANAVDAQLMEIAENVFRNNLSAMDLAIFIQSYRDIWETKYKKISAGRPADINSANLSQLISEEQELGFSAHVADRLGLSKRSIERSNQIAKNLPVSLRDKLRGTPAADNQSVLLKFAKLKPAKRAKAAMAYDKAEGDIAKVFDYLEDSKKAKPSKQQQILDRLIDGWGRADKKTITAFLKHAGLTAEKVSK